VTKRILLTALGALTALSALAVPGSAASAAPLNVYTAPSTFTSGFESTMAFTPTSDPTLLAQLDNQQGSDADSTMYSQAFQPAADGTVDTITWWGYASGEAGFMVALQDGVWGSSASLPNGPVIEGTLTQLSVVPVAQVTQTPAANGQTEFQITIPATAVFATHAYRLSVTSVGGYFLWDGTTATGCCTGTTAIQWVRGRLQSYLSATNVSFSLDNSAGPSVAPVVTSEPAPNSVAVGQTYSMAAAASGSPTPTVQWQRSTDGGTTWSDVAGATATTYSATASAADNGAWYRAVFTNSLSSATSTPAALTVAPMAIAPVTLAPAVHGTPYSAALTVVGGTGPYTWKLAPGSAHLPKGLKLNKTTGVISGTPKSAGSTNVTVEVLDTKTATKPRTQDVATLALALLVS
jgi:hypothetical protein